MKTGVENAEQLRKWIAEGEHARQDFKFLVADARKIARTLCAFANAQGGRLLIGVKDNGSISGIRSDEEFYMLQTASQLFTLPRVSFKTDVLLSAGKQVLCVQVSASAQRPHLFRNEADEWVPYYRLGDRDVRADAVLLRNWELEQLPRGNVRAFGQAEARLLEFLQTHPYITVSRCRRVTGLKIGPSIELLATLLRWNIIDILPHLEGVAYRLKPN
jgi:predicted HTH transcriptional regulator